jgi:hypothetical protein
MRTMIAAIAFLLCALLVAPVKAAPVPGDCTVIACGGETATPMGWKAPLQGAGWHIVPGDKQNLWDAVVFLGLLLALIALLPDFEHKDWNTRDQHDTEE